jgi:branched-chain amino acid aminotransferase
LQSGSISNVFVVSGGKVTTPATQEELGEEGVKGRVPYARSCVLPGVTRGAVMELCGREGVPVEAGAVDINGLLGAEEVFVTNSIMGVMPVCRIERKAIGNDRPGPVTVRLMEAYAKLVEGEQG